MGLSVAELSSRLRGVQCAMVTPFQEDGSLDERVFRAHIDYLIEAGVHILLPAGTTGEYRYLGSAVSVDSGLITTGAPGDGQVAEAAGAVYVFAGSGSDWIQKVKLVASDGSQDDTFGIVVSADGWNILAGTDIAESAYVFRRDPSADLNGDNTVEYKDFVIMADQWR